MHSSATKSTIAMACGVWRVADCRKAVGRWISETSYMMAPVPCQAHSILEASSHDDSVLDRWDCDARGDHLISLHMILSSSSTRTAIDRQSQVMSWTRFDIQRKSTMASYFEADAM